MSISTRLSIHWPESEPTKLPEKTDTLVLDAPSGEYVDIRAYKSSVLEQNPKLKEFPFEWAFAGKAFPVKDDPSKSLFSHDFFDSAYIFQVVDYETKKSTVKPDRSKIPIDCGKFKTIEGGVREETGEMMNPTTGKVEPYVEHWVSVDTLKSSPGNLVRAGSETPPPVEYSRYDIEDTENYEGRFIRVGVWAEGLVWDKKDLETPISVIRQHFDGTKWEEVVGFGSCVDALKGLSEMSPQIGYQYTFNEVAWTCKESGVYEKASK